MSDRILYVDDDTANLTVMKAACGAEFGVLTAGDGRSALELMERHDVAVVLADQRMPGMTGVDVLERVRADYPSVIRVLVTAYSDIREASAAINRAHVHRYLRKPWQPEELRTLLRDALHVHRTEDRLRELERRFMETERVYALGVVAASVAHEVRNPLTALIGHLDVARHRMDQLMDRIRSPDADTGSRLEACNAIALNLDRAVSTTETVIQITRGVESGARRDDSGHTADLRDLIETTLLMVKAELSRKALLHTSFEPVPPVRGSRSALGQVILNLVVNALQALPDGRPRSENVIAISLARTDSGVELAVTDNGVGVPAAIRDRLFDTFFTTKREGGTGLGLAISKRIVEESGGAIALVSTEGHGARFTVTLQPIAERPTA